MSTLLVTPLQSERDHIVSHCVAQGLATTLSSLGRLPTVVLPELELTLACGGTGKAQFALQTQHLLDAQPVWDLIICAGAAGGLADTVSIGDLVVATQTVEHDYNNRFSDRPRPSFDGAPDFLASLRETAAGLGPFRVHFGVVASGDEDVVAPERRHALRLATGGLAVAWEGAGGARACAFNRLPFVEIRGVTDAADHAAAAHFEQNLETAMGNLATLVTAWIRQGKDGAGGSPGGRFRP